MWRRSSIALRLVAVALYGAYWGLWLFDYLDIHRGTFPYVLFGAVTVGLPCFLVGAVVGSWWAPAVGLFFVAFSQLGERCVAEKSGGFDGVFCSGLALSDVPLVLAITTPCVLAGVVAAKLARSLNRRLREA